VVAKTANAGNLVSAPASEVQLPLRSCKGTVPVSCRSSRLPRGPHRRWCFLCWRDRPASLPDSRTRGSRAALTRCPAVRLASPRVCHREPSDPRRTKATATKLRVATTRSARCRWLLATRRSRLELAVGTSASAGEAVVSRSGGGMARPLVPHHGPAYRRCRCSVRIAGDCAKTLRAGYLRRSLASRGAECWTTPACVPGSRLRRRSVAPLLLL
jgi:hypothetical protein